VYDGQDTQAELVNLLPVTGYKLSLLCRRDKDSSRDGHETMRACARQMVTRGARNLVANPSFEERGPQQYVKYFDSNYMQIEPNSFPAHWHSMMTPVGARVPALCLCTMTTLLTRTCLIGTPRWTQSCAGTGR
jgi:hypothetical protein